MLFNNKNINESEITKLISFAFDLYEDKLDFDDFESDLFPRLYTYSDYSYQTFKINKGCVWGSRGYPNHSESKVYTQLGLTVGDITNDKLNFDYAIMFSIFNKNEYSNISIMEIEEDKYYKPKLKYSSKWEKLSEQEQLDLFINSMVILGFNADDVKKVINGTLTARQAYINIAPEDKKYKQWVNYGRAYYYFDDNVIIEGHLSNINSFDKFPFPFDGEVIIDCKKVSPACIRLGDNKRKVRLINVNENKEGLWGANLRNATIDEIIDLNKVNASGTKFGHHKIINLENSITDLNDMDLTLACDIDGNNLKINEEQSISNFETNENNNLKIYANVDTKEMLSQAIDSNGDGIGLIRIETPFYSKTKLDKYISLLLLDDYLIEDNQELLNLLEEFKLELKKLLEPIFSNFDNKEITIRLLDFRIEDICKYIGKTITDLEQEYYIYDFKDLRGSEYYFNNHTFLLKAQLEAIFETCKKYNRNINILIPFIDDIFSLEVIKGNISAFNEKYKVDYKLGAMIENIQSIYNADKISKLVDFASFGLNDLTESIVNKSRNTNDKEFHYLIDIVKNYIVEAIYRLKVGNENIIIGACGEHTNNLENFDFFDEIGIDYISVTPSIISILKDNPKLIKSYKI